jgi:hypothetical protein
MSLNTKYQDDEGVEQKGTAEKLFMMHPTVIAEERTMQREEMGKYVIIHKKGNEEGVNGFIDFTCEYENNSDLPREVKHQTYPKIRRRSTSKWASLNLECTSEINMGAEETKELRNKPQNHWNRKQVIMTNRTEEFPGLPNTVNKEKRVKN